MSAGMGTDEEVRKLGTFHRQLTAIGQDVEKFLDTTEVVFPFELPKFDIKDRPAYGADMKHKHFLLSDDFVMINHGAFGSSIKESLDTLQKFQRVTEQQPLRFLDRLCLPLMAKLMKDMSEYINCDVAGLVPVGNTTKGIDSVLKSFPLGKGDSVYFLDVNYGAVKTCIHHVCELTGATPIEAQYPYPLTGPQQIIDVVKETLPASGCKLAVFDHIPSNVPTVMPIKELIELCHSRGIPVLVDGAHGLGSVTLDLRDMNPDFYVTNAHKWFSAPKSAALMYVAPKYREVVKPLVVSWGFHKGLLPSFFWAGTEFCANYFAMFTALNFWKSYDGPVMRTYCYDLLQEAVAYLEDLWKTKTGFPPSMFCTMGLVRLPGTLADPGSPDKFINLANMLHFDHHMESPIRVFRGVGHIRLSAQVYNSMDEFRKLGEAVLKMEATYTE